MAMSRVISRRSFVGAGLASVAGAQAAPPIVDTHIHLFSPDQATFPYHANAPYRPEASPLDDYVVFARAADISHVVIVHPEPYQDDHSYLEYCFANEPSEMFFKGTCLFDPTAPATPERMAELAGRNPNRIVALRIHCTRDRDTAPTEGGAIRDRDLTHEMVRHTIRAAHRLGMAIQIHMIPVHAPQVHFLAGQFPETVFVIDHLARSGFGTPAEFAQVMEMASLPNVYMKFSGMRYSSRVDYPYRDARALVRQVYYAFGPERMLWGGLGKTLEEHCLQLDLFEETFAFISEQEKQQIRGGNAMRLFWK